MIELLERIDALRHARYCMHSRYIARKTETLCFLELTTIKSEE